MLNLAFGLINKAVNLYTTLDKCKRQLRFIASYSRKNLDISRSFILRKGLCVFSSRIKFTNV